MEQPQEIFRCSQCRMEYHADGFNVDRLGRRRKGCKKCSALNRSYRARRAPLKCEHGKITYQCSICKPESYVLKVITKRISRALATEERAGRMTADLMGCSIPELIEYLQPQLDELGVTWADYVDKWILDYRLQIGQSDDGKYRKGWQDKTGRWVRATLEQSVELLHYTNLKPKMSDPDWARGVRHGRNHLDDEEVDVLLTEFGF